MGKLMFGIVLIHLTSFQLCEASVKDDLIIRVNYRRSYVEE